jgi:hypothetical protein
VLVLCFVSSATQQRVFREGCRKSRDRCREAVLQRQEGELDENECKYDDNTMLIALQVAVNESLGVIDVWDHPQVHPIILGSSQSTARIFS